MDLTEFELLALIQKNKKLVYGANKITPTQFNNHEETTKLMVLLLEHHFYILYFNQAGRFILDGANACIEEETREAIEEMVDCDLTPKAFNQQTGWDHSASSAIMIALMIMRSHHDHYVPEIEITAKATYKRIKAQVNKGYSRPLNPGKKAIQNQIKRVKPRKCKECGETINKSFQAFRAHENNCSK